MIDGVEMDLDRRRYETFDELGSIANAWRRPSGWLHPHLGISRAGGLRAGPASGIALQLTNILRDLKEDAPAGRVYLPPRTCGSAATRPTICWPAWPTSGSAG